MQHGESISIISDMEETIRNTLLREEGAIAGCSGGENDLENLRGVGKLYNLEDDFENLQKARENLGNLKIVAYFGGKKRDSSPAKGKEKKRRFRKEK